MNDKFLGEDNQLEKTVLLMSEAQLVVSLLRNMLDNLLVCIFLTEIECCTKFPK